jgi:hypothetical protein
MMGDHSKCGINTMFTGTVIGLVRIFFSGFPRNFVPSFFLGGVIFLHTLKKHLKRQD